MGYSGFGLEAKKVMLDQNIKLKDLAAQVGISSSYLCEILKGTRTGQKQRERIAEILGLEIVVRVKK